MCNIDSRIHVLGFDLSHGDLSNTIGPNGTLALVVSALPTVGWKTSWLARRLDSLIGTRPARVAGHQQDREITWGLIMLLGCRRFEEVVTAYVIAHKEGI